VWTEAFAPEAGADGTQIMSESKARLHYEDCQIGDRIVTPGRTITESDVVMFAAFSGDWNSVHTDREFAEQNSPFGERIAHGMLGLVVGSSLISKVGWDALYPQSLICLSGLDRVKFKLPIMFGDTIHLDAEIIDLKEMPGGETGLVTARQRIRNQRDEVVISARVTVMAGRRPA
jgi:3-hydroxybutyryl-CoA dehydratase